MRKAIGYARMKIERRARWDAKWRPINRLLMFLEDGWWRLRRKQVIECFGDSHVKVMRRLNWMYPECAWRFRTVSVMGATAYGLGSRQSSTRAAEIFEARLMRLNPGSRVFFMLGEVDTGYLCWARAAKSGRDVDECMRESLERYVSFLRRQHERGLNIIVSSAPLPTVERNEDAPGYLSVRRQVPVSKKDRTALALRFNAGLASACQRHGWCFVDLDQDSLDTATGMVRTDLMSANPQNHHYDERAFAKLLIARLVQDLGGEE